MVAFTGFNRPDTYIISTASGGAGARAASSFITNSNCNKTAKMKSPTTTIMVKTLAVASKNPTKVPMTANIIKTTLASPVHRFLSPKQSMGVSSPTSSLSLNNTTATTTTTIPSLKQQTNYSPSCPSSTSPSSPSWTAFLGQNSGSYSDSDDSNCGHSLSPVPSDNSNCGEPKKRRRLTHLTPEEKILRRKLKNRVAAQTARDRKKAQMTDMEETIANLQAENKRLQQYNNTLQKKAFNLATENAELRHRLGQLKNGECNASNSTGESAALVKTEPKSPRSAEPSVPQLKKQALALSHLIMQFTCFLSLVTYSHFWMKYAAQTLVPILTIVHLHHSQHQQQQQQQSVIRKKKMLLFVQCRAPTKWWGPHQQNWTPSMN